MIEACEHGDQSGTAIGGRREEGLTDGVARVKA